MFDNNLDNTDDDLIDEELNDLIAYFIGSSSEESPSSFTSPSFQIIQFPRTKPTTIYYGDGFLDVWINMFSPLQLQKANELLSFEFDASLPFETAKCITDKFTYNISKDSCLRELTPVAIANARVTHLLQLLESTRPSLLL